MNHVEVIDSRRLTGSSMLLDRPGAILDVACPAGTEEALEAAWREEVGRILAAVGWGGEGLSTRTFPGGLNLVHSAPVDALFAATEVNEWALEAAQARIEGGPAPDVEEAADRLRRLIDEERSPALLRLREAAGRRGVTFLADDETASVGLGTGSLSFAVDDLPDPDRIDWSKIHDVPVALVTGTNGKSTTVRLLASMAAAAGRVPGFSSTDGVVVGETLVTSGDYSGPEGARRVLRDPRTEVALLETARGGLLRRGLAVPRADAALVTNIAEDHLGEWGLSDLDTLARIKLVVALAVDSDERLVLNAEDPVLVAHAERLRATPAWFALDVDRASVPLAAWLEGEMLVLSGEGVVGTDEIPIAMGGAARHNIANALAAMLVASRIGLDRTHMADGLRRFSGSPEENPGRGNLFDLGGVRAIVDYAHNPHGFRALFEMAAAIPAARRLIVLGQVGDRPDEATRELVRIVTEAAPDRVVIKEMETLLRGREKGEIPALIDAELRRQGMPEETICRAASEIEAVTLALGWAREGDLLFLLIHQERPEVLALLERLARTGWQPGDELPPA